jgi:hypothetical protein
MSAVAATRPDLRPARQLGPKATPARPSTDLAEEAIALLRRTPAMALLFYYLGAVPYWLGVMYFVADASRSAFAGERLASSSLIMALLFLHMKCWHAVFGDRLRAVLIGRGEPWTIGRVLRLIATQAAWQPSGLIVRPIAYVATLPTVWASAFYQNLTLLGDGRVEAEGESATGRAWAQTMLWPMQAHGIYGAMLLFGFFVWVNVTVVLAMLPSLLKMLFAWETMASRNQYWWTNSTFFAVTFALAFLLLDPLWKCIFALRCFYGESIRSGADLRVLLKGVRR